MGGVIERAWRSDEFGASPYPPELAGLPLPPPTRLPLLDAQTMRKQWRYVGVYGPDLMICAAVVKVGPGDQTFWAVWDRKTGELHERTHLRRTAVEMHEGRVLVKEKRFEINLSFSETPGFEVVTPGARSWIWTRKQIGTRFTGTVRLGDRTIAVDSFGMIDDSAGYHPRHTEWRWSTGVGKDAAGHAVAWNFVNGMHDRPEANENAVLAASGITRHDSCLIATDLGSVDCDGGRLEFHEESRRSAKDNRIIIRSDYAQPFGTFTGTLPGGIELAEGYGVMEVHDVRW